MTAPTKPERGPAEMVRRMAARTCVPAIKGGEICPGCMILAAAFLSHAVEGLPAGESFTPESLALQIDGVLAEHRT